MRVGLVAALAGPAFVLAAPHPYAIPIASGHPAYRWLTSRSDLASAQNMTIIPVGDNYHLGDTGDGRPSNTVAMADPKDPVEMGNVDVIGSTDEVQVAAPDGVTVDVLGLDDDLLGELDGLDDDFLVDLARVAKPVVASAPPSASAVSIASRAASALSASAAAPSVESALSFLTVASSTPSSARAQEPATDSQGVASQGSPSASQGSPSASQGSTPQEPTSQESAPQETTSQGSTEAKPTDDPSAVSRTKHRFGKGKHRPKKGKASTSVTINQPSFSSSKQLPGNCINSAFSRQCWTPGFNLLTPIETRWPETGRTVRYSLEVTEQIQAPDGVPRTVRVFNGQIPGPVIEANWGDIIEVFVRNNLPRDGTSIHWHGMHMLDNNDMDGTNGLTECPIAPGNSRVYRFRATQFGTTWYHSHYSSQYADGTVGPIVIHGPSSANWDHDAGPVILTDWYHETSEDISEGAQTKPMQEMPDNALVNGHQPSPNGGRYAVIELEPGKRNLVRFINSGLDQSFHVRLDGHRFTVMAADLVPIDPFETDELIVNVGQRYDVVVGGQGQSGSYWLRIAPGARGEQACDGGNRNPDIRAVVRYRGSPARIPTSTGAGTRPGCEDMTGLVPYRPISAPRGVPRELKQSFSQTEVTGNLVRWFIDFSEMVIDWRKPTLQYVLERTLETIPRPYNVYPVGRGPTDWTYWVIQADSAADGNPPRPHPIHLHGHDFLILAQGTGKYNGNVPLQFNNPIRRDTAMLPTEGYLVLAFETNNPGAWLMHCHVPFHIAMGFGLQFLERGNEIAPTVRDGLPELQRVCNVWNDYTRRVGTLQVDSGL